MDIEKVKGVSRRAFLTLENEKMILITQQTKLSVYDAIDRYDLTPSTVVNRFTGGRKTKILDLTNKEGKDLLVYLNENYRK